MSTENEHLALWNKVEKVPTNFLKKIGFGPLKGKSDINPQWRLKELTKEFGQCGDGWHDEVIEHWTEEAVDGNGCTHKALFVVIALHIKGRDGYVTGTGGSMLAVWDKNGMHMNTEAMKMAETDAIGVACKKLGFASAIYEGRFDGSKYQEETTGNTGSSQKPSGSPKSSGEGKGSGEDDKLPLAERRKLIAAFKKIEVDVATIEELIGKPQSKWLTTDIGTLQGHWKDENKKFKAGQE